MNAKNPGVWKELAEVLRMQAQHFENISDALERNNIDDVRENLGKLLQLVASRQSVAVQTLAPVLEELVQEVFGDVPQVKGKPEGP